MIFRTFILAQNNKEKSRRDGTLLTVDFNLRTRSASCSSQSPAGTTLRRDKMSSLRDLVETWRTTSVIRRLTPTVNQVLSLRDILPQTKYCCDLFIFTP
jgi:hypothetical protein